MAAVDLLSDVWARVAALAQESDTFRLRLMSMPVMVLNENGAGLPPSLHTEVVDDGHVPAGTWEMRRHGDKTTLVLGLAAKRCPAAARSRASSSGR